MRSAFKLYVLTLDVADAVFHVLVVLDLLHDLTQIQQKLVAIDPESRDVRTVRFNLARAGQRLGVDIVFVGRGTITGRTLALKSSSNRIESGNLSWLK